MTKHWAIAATRAIFGWVPTSARRDAPPTLQQGVGVCARDCRPRGTNRPAANRSPPGRRSSTAEPPQGDVAGAGSGRLPRNDRNGLKALGTTCSADAEPYLQMDSNRPEVSARKSLRSPGPLRASETSGVGMVILPGASRCFVTARSECESGPSACIGHIKLALAHRASASRSTRRLGLSFTPRPRIPPLRAE